MAKNIFKDDEGNIHFGGKPPDGFFAALKNDVNNALESLGNKKLWRCNVCNDLQISAGPLEECPTCKAKNAYVEIEIDEFKKLLDIL